MANIIYGVSGQGFGHATRSKEILDYLVSKGHKVLVFTYGQALFFLDHDFDVVEIPGLGLTYKNNKLAYWDTFYKTTKQLFKQTRGWHKNLKRFKDFKPDLVITDFEPFTSTLAKAKMVPLVSLDNQHQLTNTKIKVPLKYKNDLLGNRMAIKTLVWGAKYYLITSFFQTPIRSKNTFLFPPLLRKEILELKPQKQDYILVYQNSNFNSIIKHLKSYDRRFIVYGANKNSKDGNIEFKEYSHGGWLNDLANCRAIIGTAGLSLITEAIHLGKPYLAVPVKKQVEQVINAIYLEKMGYGMKSFGFSKGILDDFFSKLDDYDEQLKKYIKSDNKKLHRAIDKIIKEFS
jgi:uncharacterized protein (TIGR00661 family)